MEKTEDRNKTKYHGRNDWQFETAIIYSRHDIENPSEYDMASLDLVSVCAVSLANRINEIQFTLFIKKITL